MSEKYGKSGEWRKRVSLSRTTKIGEDYVKVGVSEGFDSEEPGFIYQKLRKEIEMILADIEGRTSKPHPSPSSTPPRSETHPQREGPRGEESRATEKQMKYVQDLCKKLGRSIPMNISKREASRLIKELAGR